MEKNKKSPEKMQYRKKSVPVDKLEIEDSIDINQNMKRKTSLLKDSDYKKKNSTENIESLGDD